MYTVALLMWSLEHQAAPQWYLPSMHQIQRLAPFQVVQLIPISPT